MTERKLTNWLESYLKYTEGTEAPRIMHTFAGVSALAGALRRKVWIDQVRFKWYPSMYIVMVADPGISTKSTTADLAMNLLRAVPGIKFGPDNVTWQSLVQSFAGSCESFEYNQEWWPMSAITLVASEFGSLMNLADHDMVNLFITLWDGRDRYEKQTKLSGSDVVEAPWINMLACTTPSWLSTNMDSLSTAGGLTSRTIYVFAEKKENYIAYLDEHAPLELDTLKANLIHDLEYISIKLTGPFTISTSARAWGRTWYKDLWENHYHKEAADWLKGYIARKQTHLHKLAMVLSVSHSDSLVIEEADLRLADSLLLEVETDLEKVFSKIGKSENAIAAEKFIDYVNEVGDCAYEDAYKVVHQYFPNFRDFEGILTGAVRSGRVEMRAAGNTWRLFKVRG